MLTSRIRSVLELCDKWTVRGEKRPTAIRSVFGWVLSGPIEDPHQQASTSVNLTSTHVLKYAISNQTIDERLDTDLERFWKLESLGIIPNETPVYN